MVENSIFCRHFITLQPLVDFHWKLISTFSSKFRRNFNILLLPPQQIKYPVDFDDKLKIGDVRYDFMT